MKKDYPFFPFWYKEFEADENVKVMTNDQIGAYLWLLISCWHEGSLPNDIKKLGALAKYRGNNFDKDIWEAVGICFRLKSTRWHHLRVDKERSKIADKHKKLSEAGKNGANIKAMLKGGLRVAEPRLKQPEPKPEPEPETNKTKNQNIGLFSQKEELKIKKEIAKTMGHDVNSEANIINFAFLISKVSEAKDVKNKVGFAIHRARTLRK